MAPEKIVEKFVSASRPGPDLSSKLIDCFRDGFPIDNLRLLIETSRYTNAKCAALCIARILGWLARPVRQEIASLLDHRNAALRFNAIYALNVMTCPDDEDILGKIGLALDDLDRRVQKAAEMHIKMHDSNALIRAAAKLAPRTIFENVSGILPDTGVHDMETLAKLIGHSDPVARRIVLAISDRPSSIKMSIDEFRRQMMTFKSMKKIVKTEEKVFHPRKSIVEEEYDLFPEYSLSWTQRELAEWEDFPSIDLIFKITKEYTLKEGACFAKPWK